MYNRQVRQQFLLILFFLLLITVQPVTAAGLRVPGNHKTIQQAIDIARSGDVILVSPGIYHERLVLRPGVILKILPVLLLWEFPTVQLRTVLHTISAIQETSFPARVV
jgi:hypothetical protein